MVHSCYSQDKDELVIQFAETEQEHYLHLILRQNFSMIRVPANLSRARKNSIELFGELKNAEVQKVFCVENERCIAILLDHGLSIVLKMFGHQSNVLVCRDRVPFKIFKNNLKDDLKLSVDSLGGPISMDKEHLIGHNWDFTRLSPTWGGKVKAQLSDLGYFELSPDEKWELMQEIQNQLGDPEFFIANHDNALPSLTLFPPKHYLLRTKDVILALNEFYLNYVRAEQFHALKKRISSHLNRQKRKIQENIKKSRKRLDQLQQNTSYREIADILMAHMHSIPEKASEVQLPEFETGSMITIKLKPALSPQKNAEQYYRKSKNQNKEIEILKKNLEHSEKLFVSLQGHLQYMDNSQQLKMLKQYAHAHNLIPSKTKVSAKPPFRSLNHDGFQILIGKSAANNDLLIQRYAHKDDLWLHAKDVKGSHVVVKQKPGHAFPQPVIEKAAQIAAHYSKRKNDSLCPVIYTPRKYIRKRKGGAAGEVIVEREQVILVVPEAPSFSHGDFE